MNQQPLLRVSLSRPRDLRLRDRSSGRRMRMRQIQLLPVRSVELTWWAVLLPA